MAGFRQGSFDFESSKRAAGSGECKKNDSLLEHFDFLLSQATRATRDQAGADRLRAHLLAQLVCLGRHTLSALLTTNGQLHQPGPGNAFCAALGIGSPTGWFQPHIPIDFQQAPLPNRLATPQRKSCSFIKLS